MFHPFTLLSANCSVCIFPYYLLKHFTGNSFRHEIESNPKLQAFMPFKLLFKITEITVTDNVCIIISLLTKIIDYYELLNVPHKICMYRLFIIPEKGIMYDMM